MRVKVNVRQRLELNFNFVLDGIGEIFLYQIGKTRLEILGGYSLLEQGIGPAGIPIPGLRQVAAIKLSQGGEGSQEIELKVGIWTNIFKNAGNSEVDCVLPSYDFSHGIFVFEVFLGHCLCDNDSIRLNQSGPGIAFQEFETENIEDGGVGKKEAGFIEALVSSGADLQRHIGHLEIKKAYTGFHHLGIFHRDGVPGRKGHA